MWIAFIHAMPTDPVDEEFELQAQLRATEHPVDLGWGVDGVERLERAARWPTERGLSDGLRASVREAATTG